MRIHKKYTMYILLTITINKMIIRRRTQMAAIITYKVASVCAVGTWSVDAVDANGGRVVGRVVGAVRSST